MFIEEDYLTKSTRLLAKIPPENITNLIKLFFGLMVKDKSLNEICSQKYFFTFLYDQLELVIQRGHNEILKEIIKMEKGMIGFPNLRNFALIFDEDKKGDK